VDEYQGRGVGAVHGDPQQLYIASGDAMVEDTWLNSQAPTTNYGGSSVLKIYQPGVAHALTGFALDGIPAGSQIVNAYLFLHTTADGENGETQVVNIHRVKADWDQLQATWNQRLTGIPWQQPGASGSNDIDLTPSGTITVTATNTEFRSTDLKDLVQGWVNGTYPNYGVLLKAPGGSWTWYNFYSAQSVDSVVWGPQLEVVYAPQ